MTDDEVAALFDQLGVRRQGHFALSSGAHSDTYLQCALALGQPATALALGRALAERVRSANGEVDVVASPALGGVLAGFAVAAALGRRFVFAERAANGRFALRRGQVVGPGERVLVVEDVVTTGGSAREVAGLVEQLGGTVVGVASLVDRSIDQRPISLLRVQAEVWDAGSCPLCQVGTPLDRPGSRVPPPAA
jgi:orotate phosphoribosyltransferase